MKKHLFKLGSMFVLFVVSIQTMSAQGNHSFFNNISVQGNYIFVETDSTQGNYSYIMSSKGVDAYWRIQKQYTGNAHMVLLKFVNRNSYDVGVEYIATFDCGGDEWDSAITLRAGETRSGEGAGLWHYPCDDNVRPGRIYLRLGVNQR